MDHQPEEYLFIGNKEWMKLSSLRQLFKGDYPLSELERLRKNLDKVIEERRGKAAKKKTLPKVIKYWFIDHQGEIHAWSGRGRAPNVFLPLINEEVLERYNRAFSSNSPKPYPES